MKTKWTFFISSTLEDLKSERQAIANQVLKMEEIPIGMEQFGAIDKSSWENIETFIDTADYYILIIAGKYGSIDHTAGGISYTEREYRYAKSKNIPIIAVLHGDPASLQAKFMEQDAERRQKLDAFRDEVKGARLVAFYTNTAELIGEVAAAIGKAKQRFPRPGWSRHGDAPQAAQHKIEELTRDLEEKNSELRRLQDAMIPRNTGSDVDISGIDYFSTRMKLSEIADVTVLLKKTGQKVEVEGKTTWMGIFIDTAIGLENATFPPEQLSEVLDERLRSLIVLADDSIQGPLMLHPNFSQNAQYVFESLGLLRRSDHGFWGMTRLGRKIYVDWRAEQIIPPKKRQPWER